ncbi:VOC family protein [Parasedimentitalea huanghaiensis]|uniref:VOC family protein n=1 Tax=Parasedimentitalea huanghaiensis TaxID=2682100 RepID=A0A6L6W9P0_9RHOB|nr:VOC family protein [Zongyanglinia huanghaiensis]MVO14330.1 VOC family protein [Zongyanglinia huanghaiensis]
MTYSPTHFLVWGELPVTDLTKACEFYGIVTGAALQIDSSGPNPIAMFKPADPCSGVALHLYPGKPAIEGSGPTLHLAAEGKLEDVMDRVTKAGGEVTSPAIEIPAGRFFYAKDPDGNTVGFFVGNDR